MVALNLHDRADFEDADRGFVAALEPGVVRAGDQVVWDNDAPDPNLAIVTP